VVGNRLRVVIILETTTLSLAAFLFFLSCPSSPPSGKVEPRRTISIDPALAEQGRRLFNLKACNLCHSLDGSPATGPSLLGIGAKADRQTLRDWCSDPELIYQREGRRPLRNGFAPMPAQNVNPSEAQALSEYLLSLTQPPGR
jgi:mono/diheme cytochrome c family protein